MNLAELLSDPSWLFGLSIPIQPVRIEAGFANPEKLEWELGDEYRIPALSSLSGEKRIGEVSVGWSDAGVLAHVVIPTQHLSKDVLEKPCYHSHADTIFFTLYLDTRWNEEVHRGSQYSHQFDLICDRPKSSKLVRGHGELMSVHRSRAAPKAVHPQDIYVGALLRSYGYEIKCFLPKDVITGYDPTEYQELGMFYVIRDARLGSQRMARSDDCPYFEDPSLWCRGKLMQSDG